MLATLGLKINQSASFTKRSLMRQPDFENESHAAAYGGQPRTSRLTYVGG
jgi:hypothetical protein